MDESNNRLAAGSPRLGRIGPGRSRAGVTRHAPVRASQGPGGSGRAAGENRTAASAPHRGRGRSADGALGRRTTLAVFAGHSRRAGGKRWAWRGSLRRGEHRMDLSEPLVLLPGLLVLGVGRAARFDDLGVMPWIHRLRYEKEITFVEPQQDLMLGRILAETRVPPLELVEIVAAGGDQRQASALA